LDLYLRDATDQLSRIDGRLGELRAVLAAAKQLSATTNDRAQLGVAVSVRSREGEEATCVPLLPAEPASRHGRQSIESPSCWRRNWVTLD